MKLELEKTPKNPIIIEGFPGFGFVSTIATEFLIKHLNATRIGKIYSNKIKPVVAIHNSEIVDPLEVYYDSKHNIIILRALTTISGAEYDVADMIVDLAEKTKAREIITLEGVAAEKEGKNTVYYFTNLKEDKFKLLDLENMKEGIVMGVTGILLLKEKELPLSCVFVEADPSLPDSRAAGEVVKVLDDYLGLKVDYKPLIKTAQEFEGKLKELLSQAQKAGEAKDKKEASYLG